MISLGPQAFQRARAIFESAVDAPAADRQRLIEQACGDDKLLLEAVQAMLRADAEPHSVLDTSPITSSARWPPGTILGGHLRIDSLAGRGGMGEVYRAHDESLGRDVAVKVLPAAALETAGLPNRLARFEREAQILAALNHPNIASIYGVVDVDGTKALILEFVDGPTLAERLAAGPLALDEVISIARQIATALEAAHENGVVHRDLKPSNIKVRPDGTVKLLDFGLAKMVQAESVAADAPSSNPAVTSDSMVQRGVLFGTPAYMSPEQAKGREIDRRSDVWAFGAVLYEMLSGERAFTGDDVAETLAAVLRAEVNLTQVRASTPEALRHLVSRCLERSASRRLRDIGEARIVLEDLDGAASNLQPTRAIQPRRRWLVPLVAASAAAVLVAAAAAWTFRPPPTAAAPTVRRFPIDLPNPQTFPVSSGRLVSVSADGQTLAYVAAGANERAGRLYRRRFDEVESVPIAEMDVHEPSLSSDGSWVAYVVNTTLKKAPTSGSGVQTLAQMPSFSRGIAWAGDGSLLAGSVSSSVGLVRVPAAGGSPEQLTVPEAGRMHWDPQVLPDDRRVLYTSISPYFGPGDVMVLDLQTRKSRTLMPGALVRLLPNGPLLYIVDNALWAVPFDTVRLEATGSPVLLVDSVRLEVGGAMQVAAADDGTIAYLAGEGTTTTRVVSFERSGRPTSLAMPPQSRAYADPRVSPDGRSLAVSMRDQDRDIWIWSFDRRTFTRLTLDSAVDTSPAWTPDGTRIIYASRRGAAAPNPYWQTADGIGKPERLIESAESADQFSMAPDGKRLVMRVRATKTADDIAMLDLGEQPRRVQTLIDTPFNERNPAVSQDGRWVAYDSDESGRREVYVRPFPDVKSGRWQVSTAGGISPRWSSGGRQLTFISGDGTWHSVPVIDGPGFQFGTASRVSPADTALTLRYDIFPDGKTFIAVQGDVAPANKRLTVLLNGLTRVPR